ncbi:hypothetical protein [Bartonella sp. LJL80]
MGDGHDMTTQNPLHKSHPKGALDRLLDPLGIRLIPVRRRRGAAQSHARATMKAIRAGHGDGFLVFVLRVIRQTRGNRDQLHSDTIAAIADIFEQRPDWMEMGGAVLDAFDQIDLAQLRTQAVKLRPWPVRATLRTMIYHELEGILDDQNRHI